MNPWELVEAQEGIGPSALPSRTQQPALLGHPPACWFSCTLKKENSTKTPLQHFRQEISGFLSPGGLSVLSVVLGFLLLLPSSFASLTGTGLLIQQNPLTSLVRAQHYGLQILKTETVLTKVMKNKQSIYINKQAR